MFRKLALTLSAAALAATGAVAHAGAADASTAHTSRILVTAPCELEDGSTQRQCVWDGGKDGNRRGLSYVNLYRGAAYAYMRAPVRPVSKRVPLVVTITGDGTVTVVQGRTVLAKRVSLMG